MPDNSTHINWFDTGRDIWDGTWVIHEWEGLDIRFSHHHYSISLWLDPDHRSMYELLICTSVNEDEIPVAIYETLKAAQKAAEEISSVLISVRSLSDS